MRSAWGRFARYLSVFLGGRSLSFGVALPLSAVALGFAFVGGGATGEAREYSAYSDPEKPAISFILSDPRNVKEFKERFDLSDEEMKKVLAVIREENKTLAREYAQSKRIVETNKGLSKGRVKKKIAASDYDEKVREAVSRTKVRVEALLPKDKRSELQAWVDSQWQQEKTEYQASGDTAYEISAQGKTCTVFATQYIGYTRYEVALPHKKMKFEGGYRVRLRIGDRRIRAPIKEVGPWNIKDDYWEIRKYRDMWKNLPRCKPEAEAAYFDNYNQGKDQFGRKVLNPAGVDLTPRVARKLGLRKYENHWVNVFYPWVRR